MEENREACANLDSDTKELLDVMADVKLSEEYNITEKGKERYNIFMAIY